MSGELFKKIYVFVNIFRGGVLWILVMSLKNNRYFFDDLFIWKKNICNSVGNNFYVFNYLLLYYKEYRNLVVFRIRKESLLKATIARILYKTQETLIIGTPNIDGGLFIEHGFATIIVANSIGKNCWINQQVTIGNGANGIDRPTIGDNVMIRAGAIIVGNVTIGNNAVVGAGAVVVHDVPAYAVVGGVPAKVIRIKTN